jgi:hypothetical protein
MKFDMRLGGFAGVMLGLFMMGMGEVRVMGARFVFAVRDVAGRFAVMLGGFLMMFGGVLGVRHGRLPFLPHLADAAQ